MGTAVSAWQWLPRIQLTTSRSRSYLPPCLVARAGRKRLPAFHRSPKTNDELLTCGIPHSGQERAYALLAQWAKECWGFGCEHDW